MKSDQYTIFMNEYSSLYSDKMFRMDSSGNHIHFTANIGDDVKLGNFNYIGAFCNIVGDTTIGDNNHFEAYCSVGTFPEHREYFNSTKMKGVVIGNNNVFREFITINAGCVRDTKLGNNIWMLRNSHIGHDSIIMDNATISCNVLIGGHSHVGEDVNMGLGSICHQFSVIGSGSMIGMGCIITKTTEIEPLKTYVGNPAKYLKQNEYKLKKLDEVTIKKYRTLYDWQKSLMETTKKEI